MGPVRLVSHPHSMATPQVGNWRDLLTDEPFKRKDLIVLQDPTDLDKHNMTKFHHLKHNLKVLNPEQEAAKLAPDYTIRAASSEAEMTMKALRESEAGCVQARHARTHTHARTLTRKQYSTARAHTRTRARAHTHTRTHTHTHARTLTRKQHTVCTHALANKLLISLRTATVPVVTRFLVQVEKSSRQFWGWWRWRSSRSTQGRRAHGALLIG